MNSLVFYVDSDDPNQVWTGEVDKAFKEFFEKKKKERERVKQAMRSNSEINYKDLPVESGVSPEHAFEASNGLRIHWENQGGRATDEDAPKEVSIPNARQQQIALSKFFEWANEYVSQLTDEEDES